MEPRKPSDEKTQFIHGILKVIQKELREASDTVYEWDKGDVSSSYNFYKNVEAIVCRCLERFYDGMRENEAAQVYWPFILKGLKMISKEEAKTASVSPSKDKSKG